MEGTSRTLRLLQRRALRKLGAENEGAKHVAEFLDAELVLKGLRTHAVDDDAERLQAGGEATADLLDGTQSAVCGGNGEQAGLGHDGNAVAGRPRRTREGIEGGRAVDEHQVVVGLDVGESLFEFPDVADARVRAVKVDGGGRTDEHVDLAGTPLRPPARRNGRANDLLLGGGEHIRDVEMTGDADVHARRHVRLRVKIDDEGTQTLGEGRGRKPERHRSLPYAPLEGADAEYVHE